MRGCIVALRFFWIGCLLTLAFADKLVIPEKMLLLYCLELLVPDAPPLRGRHSCSRLTSFHDELRMYAVGSFEVGLQVNALPSQQ